MNSHVTAARGPKWRLGFDVGFEQDPTALALIRRALPNVLLPLDRDGVPWDADRDAPLELQEGTTLAQHMAPTYQVTDLQRRTGLTFEAIAAGCTATRGLGPRTDTCYYYPHDRLHPASLAVRGDHRFP